GGARIRIESGTDMTFSGIIRANGSDGGAGGNGGNGGSSPRCCSDLCAGVDEYTHTGAGGGGGGAGGGSGGGILLKVNGVANITGTLTANGGDGGTAGTGGNSSSMSQSACFSSSTANMPAGFPGNDGGGGSGGRTKVLYNACAPGNNVSPTMQASGGTGNGGPAQVGSTYSGTDGSFILGSAQPALQQICFNGDPGNLNSLPATGGYGAIAYQWQFQPNCTGPWTNIAGATGLNHDPPPGLQSTTCYRLEITSGTCTEFSDTLQVDVINQVFANVDTTGPVPGCQGDSVRLTTTGGSGANYQWFMNGIPIPGATDSFLVAMNDGAYTVQISFSVGCDAISMPTNLTFAPPPPAFIAVSSDTILCPGETVDLQAFSGTNYQWQLNGSNIPGANTNMLQASGAGTYTVMVSSAAGCTNQDSVMITAGLVPSAGISANGATNFCDGDSVILNGSGGGTYQWLQNGFPVAGATMMNYSAMSSGDYTVVVTNADGCADTSAVETVVADPIPDAVLMPATIPVSCEGDSALFLASGGGSYEWFFNTGALPDTTSFLYASVPGDYLVVVTSPAGCTDTSQTFAFTWFPPAMPTVNASGSPFLCPGETLDMQAIAPQAVAWQWMANDTAVPGATNANFTATGPGTYSVLITDANGCSYESPLFNVFPGENPQAEIVPQGTFPFCFGDSILLQGSGGLTYQWILDGVAIPGATDSMIYASMSGIYSLVVTTGCGQDTSPPLSTTISDGPQAGFTYENHPEDQVQLIDASISGATWLWDFGGGGPTSTEQNPFQSFPGPGEYLVTMITWDEFGCSDTIAQTILVVDPDFFIPNAFSPNNDGINDVAWTHFGLLTDVEFRIFDRWGTVVFLTTSPNEFWDGTINGKQAPESTYFFDLQAVNPQGEEVRETGHLTLVR
ncbi:MAG: T9SS type B sorting domain-containing protein, partial [Bacteroidota bacterium]